MKELSRREVSPKKVREDRSLKARERGLARDVAKKKELAAQEKLEKEIKRFESIGRKKMVDYDVLLVKLRSVKYDLEYLRDTSDGDTDRIDKKIKKVDELIDKYQNEQIDLCMQQSEDVLERAIRVLRE